MYQIRRTLKTISLKNNAKLLLPLLSVLLLLFSFTNEKTFIINEHFSSLDNWREIDFGHSEHTKYEIITNDDNHSFLKSTSNATATAMLYKNSFNVYDHPNIEWKWQVNNIIKKATLTKKEGDDFPLAVYVLFKYDYKKLGYFERMSYNTKKALYGGEEPPHSTLRFVWSSYQDKGKKIYVTPYQDSGRNYLVEVGEENLGKWVLEKENIVEIYKKAFGKNPPSMATIGFMNDSDNTKESAVSYLDYIHVY